MKHLMVVVLAVAMLFVGCEAAKFVKGTVEMTNTTKSTMIEEINKY